MKDIENILGEEKIIHKLYDDDPVIRYIKSFDNVLYADYSYSGNDSYETYDSLIGLFAYHKDDKYLFGEFGYFKENREELKQILINYAIAEYRMLDKKVIKKIDPSICEVLVRFSKKYNYNVQSLIYNYAMSFSKSYESDMENIPNIIYNFAYLKETNLDKKEKKIIAQIYKNARKNNKIDIIGDNVGIKKVKYILKRILTINDTNALPEGKY